MEFKKNPLHNLENFRLLFIQIGLVVSVSIVYGAIEYTSNNETSSLDEKERKEEIEDVPQTIQEPPPPPPDNAPPPPPPPPDKIDIVEDDVEIEEEIVINDVDAEPDLDLEEEDDGEIFRVVEQMPQFPGGDAALMKYIANKVRYPQIAKEYGIEGRVFVTFVIDKKGKVKDVEIIKGVDPNLDKEAKRVIESLPKFTPGKQRGKAVRVQFTVPISFKLQ